MTKAKGKKVVDSTMEEKTQVPTSRSYICDYMLTWENGKMVVKYVGAYTKRQATKRSVWVPKSIVTNHLGPKSIWVPKRQA